jgi:hypothetical protein
MVTVGKLIFINNNDLRARPEGEIESFFSPLALI